MRLSFISFFQRPQPGQDLASLPSVFSLASMCLPSRPLHRDARNWRNRALGDGAHGLVVLWHLSRLLNTDAADARVRDTNVAGEIVARRMHCVSRSGSRNAPVAPRRAR